MGKLRWIASKTGRAQQGVHTSGSPHLKPPSVCLVPSPIRLVLCGSGGGLNQALNPSEDLGCMSPRVGLSCVKKNNKKTLTHPQW